MDDSASPWRALDAGAPRPAAAESPPDPTQHRLVAAGAFVLAAAIAVGAFFVASSAPTGTLVVDGAGAPSGPIAVAAASVPAQSAGPTTELVVEVVGAVLRPGVYRLPNGARVGDAINAAGGYGPRVDADRASRELNLAQPLMDGLQIRVPSRDDPTPPVAATVAPPPGGVGSSGNGGETGGPIDLNTATSAELEELPGIGPVTAAKIIAAREEQPFTSVTELESRDVLGPATYEKVRELVTVR